MPAEECVAKLIYRVGAALAAIARSLKIAAEAAPTIALPTLSRVLRHRLMPAVLLPVLLCPALTAQAVEYENVLPPLAPWQAKSLDLIAAPDDPWITPAEETGLTATPRYAETIQWLQRLVAKSPQLKMVSIGRSDQGRDIWMIVASSNGASSARQLARNKKPVLLVQAGIHSGEIDGKDAGMMLLRDMTVAGKRRELLDKVNLLFIPILNVDGHERFSAYGRINQRGPSEMGWRTNRRNLNLNRDYTKLETPGIRAVVRVINQWRPDLYVDVHVTDGVDYQYDITWGYNGSHAWSPGIAGWLAGPFEAAANRDLSDRGHVPGPLIFSKNHEDYAAGTSLWTASPRYSNGYGDARHLPTVLVENHSLKPYMQRVLGTYVLLESMMRTLGEQGAALRKAIREDRQLRRDEIVLEWEEDAAILPESMLLQGIASTREYSPISGGSVVRWSGVPAETSVAARPNDQPAAIASRPSRYYIPAVWAEVADKLRLHGIEVQEIESITEASVQYYRVANAAVAGDTNPFEGRMRIDPGVLQTEIRKTEFGPGDYTVDTDQALGTLVVLLLEPQSPDSFFQWGYFLEIMNRTEYFESYVVEPMARQMLLEDSELARRFREKLKQDEVFAKDPKARLHWFYEQSPFHDDEYRLYPIARSLD